MNHWMEVLGRHYRKMKEIYPKERLIIVFDIDGTILDMRFVIHFVLQKFDRDHGTSHFKDVKISDIDFHEANLKHLLNRLSIPEKDQRYILSYYENMLLPALTIKKANRPYRGVLGIIKWFQSQKNTFVGLNTGRPESLRFKTLSALNLLGKEYGVQFSNYLLHMNPYDLDADIPSIKRMGIKYFEDQGFKVFAFVDNEPENLEAVSELGGEILLLHADTISKSKIKGRVGNLVSGKDYDVERLVSAVNY